MKIDELTGAGLRRALSMGFKGRAIKLSGKEPSVFIASDRAFKSYHCRNKAGGKFCFTITKNGGWFDLYGKHDAEGNITSLNFGPCRGVGRPLNLDLSRSVEAIGAQILERIRNRSAPSKLPK